MFLNNIRNFWFFCCLLLVATSLANAADENDIDALLDDADDLLEEPPEKLPPAINKPASHPSQTQPKNAAEPKKQENSPYAIANEKELRDIFTVESTSKSQLHRGHDKNLEFFLCSAMGRLEPYSLEKDDTTYAVDQRSLEGITLNVATPGWHLSQQVMLRSRLNIYFDQSKQSVKQKGVDEQNSSYGHTRALSGITFGPQLALNENFSFYSGVGAGMDVIQQTGEGNQDSIFYTDGNIVGVAALQYKLSDRWHLMAGAQKRGIAGIGLGAELYSIGVGFGVLSVNTPHLDRLRQHESH